MIKKFYIVIGIVTLCITLMFIDKALTQNKIENYCKDKGKDCVCEINYILDNVSYKNRKKVLETIDKGYIIPNQELTFTALRAIFICKD